MNLLLTDLTYVVNDPFFLPSMAFTTMIGIFIGAVIYNGDIKEVKKMVLALLSYAILIAMVTLTRVIPRIINGLPTIHPYAQILTIVVVTLFYLFGTYIGVKITRYAHNKRTEI